MVGPESKDLRSCLRLPGTTSVLLVLPRPSWYYLVLLVLTQASWYYPDPPCTAPDWWLPSAHPGYPGLLSATQDHPGPPKATQPPPRATQGYLGTPRDIQGSSKAHLGIPEVTPGSPRVHPVPNQGPLWATHCSPRATQYLPSVPQ